MSSSSLLNHSTNDAVNHGGHKIEIPWNELIILLCQCTKDTLKPQRPKIEIPQIESHSFFWVNAPKTPKDNMNTIFFKITSITNNTHDSRQGICTKKHLQTTVAMNTSQSNKYQECPQHSALSSQQRHLKTTVTTTFLRTTMIKNETQIPMTMNTLYNNTYQECPQQSAMLLPQKHLQTTVATITFWITNIMNELTILYFLCTKAKASSDPEVVKITSNNEWTLHSEMPLHPTLSNPILPSNQSKTSKVLGLNQNLVVISCSRSNSHHKKLQQFCREFEFCYALAAKSHSNPEVVKIMNEHSIPRYPCI